MWPQPPAGRSCALRAWRLAHANDAGFAYRIASAACAFCHRSTRPICADRFDGDSDRTRGRIVAGGGARYVGRVFSHRTSWPTHSAHGDGRTGYACGHECPLGGLAVNGGGRKTKPLLPGLWIVAAAVLGGCTQTALSPERADRIEAAFVVLGIDGQAVARVITRADACPLVVVDDAPQPMAIRAAPATLRLRPTRSGPEESKPSAFPVLVCDALLGARTLRASVGGRALPVPKRRPERIVVIGDTGCRLKRADGIFQACNDRDAWPFADVADAAAAMHPDLVVHVGDYHYRENACPPGNAGCSASPWGYGWDAWDADFFTPAKRLLAVAPWIVVRGNHESCDRAGQGWWRFLDPRPLVAGRDCNDP